MPRRDQVERWVVSRPWLCDDLAMRARTTEKRLACCVCGTETDDSPDYVEMEIVTDGQSPASQVLGAHAECLNRVLADGFRVEYEALSD